MTGITNKHIMFVFLVAVLTFIVLSFITGSLGSPVKKSISLIYPSPSPSSSVSDTYLASIKDINVNNNKTYIHVDYVEWLEGQEALDACRLADKCRTPSCQECIPNGYFISNLNTQINKIELSSQLQIHTYQDGGVEPVKTDLSEFITLINSPPDNLVWIKDAVFEIEITDNLVTSITQRYQPKLLFLPIKTSSVIAG